MFVLDVLNLIIMGIDPGLAILGYGLIEMKGNKFVLLHSGAIITQSNISMPDRLLYI